MIKGIYRFLLCAVFCGFWAFHATAATSLFSDYGQIQNVQNYSTNPFWTPNAPYNQRLPQPVYVQGADLTAEDCFKAVQSLVSVQCMARDNCKNTTLAEIRPTVMVQLSNLPGNNYVSACSGYIDTIFEQYVAQYGNSVPNRAVAFPTATTPNQNLNDNNNSIEIKNPYQQIPNQWQKEYIERSQELQQLQEQNGAGSEHLSATAFPKTFEDLSFKSRMELKTEGYEPYKDMQAYVVPDFKTKKEWCEGKGSGSEICQKEQNEQQEPNGKTCKPTDKNATEGRLNSNGKCLITKCKTGYKPNTQRTACIKEQTSECDDIDPKPAHATEMEKNDQGVCIVTKCESGWKPTSDGAGCEDEDVYYTLALCWTGSENQGDFTKYYCEQSYYDTNKCFPVCGQGVTYYSPIAQSITKLFGGTDTLCVPSIKPGKKYSASETHKFSVINEETKEQIRFGKDKLNAVRQEMYNQSDEISANRGNSKPCDGYNKNIDSIIIEHKKGQSPKTHTIIRIDD